MRAALIDLSPLRASKTWRWLWVGNALNAVGGLVGDTAVLWYIWEVTHSTVWTGGLALARAVPSIVLAVIGGSVADRMDRRVLAVWASVGQCALTAVMAVLMIAGALEPWVLVALVALRAGAGSIAAPARKTFTVTLLPAEKLTAGLALDHATFQIALLGGPVVGGLITGAWGPDVCLVIDALTFVISLLTLVRLPSMKAIPTTPGLAQSGWRAAVAGFSFVGRSAAVRSAYLVDLCAMVLAMPVALFPVINDERYGGAPETLGFFLSAVAVGGLVATVFSGTVSASDRSGRVMVLAAGAWGLGILTFGLTGHLAVALAALIVAGVGDTLSVVARGTMVQLVTPDEVRGRVNAIDYVVGASGPDLGNFRAGLVAAVIGAGPAIAVGGAMCLAGVAVIGWRSRAVWSFTTRAYRSPGQ